MRADDGVGGWFKGDRLSPKIAEFVAPRPRPDVADAVTSGIKAGVVGSVMAWVLLALVYANSGGDATIPVRLIGLRLFGGAYFAGYGAGLAVGAVAWLTAGAAFGALFGVIMSRLVGRVGVLAAVGVGMTYGVLLWIVTIFVVVAYLAPELVMLYDQHALAWAYAVYGACLGLMGRSYRTAVRLRL
jgi:hypothetical protein